MRIRIHSPGNGYVFSLQNPAVFSTLTTESAARASGTGDPGSRSGGRERGPAVEPHGVGQGGRGAHLGATAG